MVKTSNRRGRPLLRRARVLAGLTQTRLAGRVGVSTSIVSQWESGDRTPGPQKVPELAHALAVPADQLLGLLGMTFE